jgi:hypothetical protein
MRQELNIKDPFSEVGFKTKFDKNEARTVKVKFNFPLASPSYEPSVATQKAKEEKSGIAFDMQLHIDLNTHTNFYEAGKVYDVTEEFYNKFAERRVETSSPVFGAFSGKELKFIKRPLIPYLLKVDEDGELLNPMDRELDLFAKDN